MTARRLVLGAAACVALCAAAAPVSAQPGTDPLAEATAAFDNGDFEIAEKSAREALGDLDDSQRAEAWRLVGLSLYFQNKLDGAEAAMLEYLKLDTEAELDPAIYSRAVVIFFVNVKTKHRTLLDKYRPKRERRRFLLTLAPPFGQFENKHRTKGLIVGGLELSLLAATVTSYVVLRSWCDEITRVCPGRQDDARKLQVFNIGVGIAFMGVYAYGVFDGVRHYRKWKRKQSSIAGSLSGYIVPTGNGAIAGLSTSF